MRALIALLVFCVPLVSRAAFVIADPNNTFRDLASFHHQGEFETSMKCGQSTTIDVETLNCTVQCGSMCMSTCHSPQDASQKQFGLYIDDCSPGLAHVYGDNGLIIDVPKAEYVAGANTYIIPFLKNSGRWITPEGTLILDGIRLQPVSFIDNGKMKSLSAHVVYVKYAQSLNDPQTEHLELLVTDQLDGARSILKFSMGQDTFFQVRGLIDSPWGPHSKGL